MLKNISRLEHAIGDRLFHLTCDQDSPLHEVKDAVLEFLKFICRVEDDVKAKAVAEAEQAAKEAVDSAVPLVENAAEHAVEEVVAEIL